MEQAVELPRWRLFSRQEWVLVLITMVWGVTFLVVRWAMQQSGPLFFVSCRFITAGLLAALVFRPNWSGISRRELAGGSLIGLAILGGYALQSLGLQSISSSQSAFITALYVPLVPLLQWFVLRRRPGWIAWLGSLLAFTGLILISGPGAGGGSLARGDLLTLLGAVAMAAEILLISHYANTVDSRRMTVIQLLVAGAASFGLMGLAHEPRPVFSWGLLACIVGLACASALIQLAMNWAQKSVSPTRATLIYAGEPVWAGCFGRLAGERLPALALLGAVLIVSSMVIRDPRPEPSE